MKNQKRTRNILIEITGAVGWYADRAGEKVPVKDSENPNFDEHWNFTDSLFVKKEHAKVLTENYEK
jgi:hypothetical protein